MTYEPRDASIRLIGTTAFLLMAGVAIALAASAWLQVKLVGRAGGAPAAPRQTSFTEGTTAEPDVVRARRSVEAAASARLQQYGWVNRKAGVARIPIDRAIELTIRGVKPVPGEIPAGQQIPK